MKKKLKTMNNKLNTLKNQKKLLVRVGKPSPKISSIAGRLLVSKSTSQNAKSVSGSILRLTDINKRICFLGE